MIAPLDEDGESALHDNAEKNSNKSCTDRIFTNNSLHNPHAARINILSKGSSVANEYENQINIPDFNTNQKDDVPFQNDDISPYKSFTFRKLWLFAGPGFLMSIAYLDPGNIESDLRSGALAQYSLLWVLLLATILGFLVQRLAIRLGVVTGDGLAELCGKYYSPIPRYLLWLMVECAIIGSDIQEVIGTAVAFHLLSRTHIPLYGGVLLTVFDTFTFLTLDKYGLRKLEAFFVALIAIMAGSFGYHYIVVAPDQLQILHGLFVPGCKGCGHQAILQAVGIIGAVIMPHNLYLHSALVRSRSIDRTKRPEVRQASFYFAVEAGFALACSFLINLAVVSVFAKGLYGVTNAQVRANCASRIAPGSSLDNLFPGTDAMFPNNTQPVEVDLFRGAIFLGCQFGPTSLYVWAIGILAAGQSATMTGTYAGQFVMQGFLGLRWTRTARIILTRAIAVGPTLFLALYTDLNALTTLNDALNVLQSFQLPFALLPLLAFTASSGVMSLHYVNSRFTTALVIALAALVFGANAYFVATLFTSGATSPLTYASILIVVVAYVIFLFYIAYRSCAIALGSENPGPALVLARYFARLRVALFRLGRCRGSHDIMRDPIVDVDTSDNDKLDGSACNYSPHSFRRTYPNETSSNESSI